MTVRGSMGEAIIAVNRSLLLVLAVGIATTYVSGGIWTYISFGSLVFAIALSLVVYGRIIADLLAVPSPNLATIIRDNWLNYLVVVLLLALPIWTARVLSHLLAPGTTALLIYIGVQVLVAVLTIYVLPIVFLKRVGIVAIPAGIIFLSHCLRSSSLIVGLVIFAFALGATRYAVLPNLPPPWSLFFIVGIGILVTYALFLAFAAASHILIRSKTVTPSVA